MRISRCTDAFCACRLLQTGVRGANAIRRGNEGTGTKDLFIRKPDSKNNNTVLGQKTGWPFLICDCHNQILLKTQKDTKKEQHTTDFLACSLQVWIKAFGISRKAMCFCFESVKNLRSQFKLFAESQLWMDFHDVDGLFHCAKVYLCPMNRKKKKTTKRQLLSVPLYVPWNQWIKTQDKNKVCQHGLTVLERQSLQGSFGIPVSPVLSKWGCTWNTHRYPSQNDLRHARK